jgi:hypothetical protein
MPSLPVKNPYSHFNNLMREIGSMDNPGGIFSGTVISISPLVVTNDKQQIDSDNNIFVNASLTLNTGDVVAIMPSADGQTFYILCKVVSV